MFLRPITRSWRFPPRLSHPPPGYPTQKPHSTHHSPPIPTIPTCPPPTCHCAATPTMPDSLAIDHTKPLNGTMAPYAEQVLICTGKDDWSSRIEEENAGDNLAADLKELVGRGGMYSDPYHNISILNTSLPSSIPTRAEVQTTSAYLLPSFKYIPFLPRVSFDSVHALVKSYLLPTKLHPAHDKLSPIHKDRLLRSEEQRGLLYGVQDVKEILVLVCGHGGRDRRCGIMGPLLREEFSSALPRVGIQVLTDPVEIPPPSSSTPSISGDTGEVGVKARVGLISHIGGHKFAGNVIIYIPPEMMGESGERHGLEGCGIWYGRVEPRHVEGIVEETVRKGRVIESLFRGGIRVGGEVLRL